MEGSSHGIIWHTYCSQFAWRDRGEQETSVSRASL